MYITSSESLVSPTTQDIFSREVHVLHLSISVFATLSLRKKVHLFSLSHLYTETGAKTQNELHMKTLSFVNTLKLVEHSTRSRFILYHWS